MEAENFAMLWIGGNKYLVGKPLADAVTAERDALRAQVDALTAERDALAEANRWVSVDERMPEVGYRYLVYDGFYDDFFKAYCNPDGSWTDIGDGTCLMCVTHYKPLPEPPQDGQP